MVDFVLFLDERKREKLLADLHAELKQKNRLLGLVISNPDRKTTRRNSSQTAIVFEEQISLLQLLADLCQTMNSREDIDTFNRLLKTYQSIKLDS